MASPNIGQNLNYGVVCSKATSGTLFVRFIHGQLMLSPQSQNMAAKGPAAKIGDIVAFSWQKYPDLDACVGVIDRYQVVPPEKQKNSFRAYLRTTNGATGPSVVVSCELRYLRKEDGVSTFINEYLGKVYDDRRKIHNNALTENGIYQCLISRFDDPRQKLHYWMVVHCQFFPETILKGPFPGYATRLPSSEHAFVWPTTGYSKRPIQITMETMSGFHESNLGRFVNYWLIPKSQTIGLMRIADAQPPLRRDNNLCLVSILCTYTGQKNRMGTCDVLRSDLYHWIEDRHGVARNIGMSSGDTAHFWCMLDVSSTNPGYADWVIHELDTERKKEVRKDNRKLEGPKKNMAAGSSVGHYASKRDGISYDLPSLEQQDHQGFDPYAPLDAYSHQLDYNPVAEDTHSGQINDWLDKSNALWERVSLPNNGLMQQDPEADDPWNSIEDILEDAVKRTEKRTDVFPSVGLDGHVAQDHPMKLAAPNALNLLPGPQPPTPDHRDASELEDAEGSNKRLITVIRQLFKDPKVRLASRQSDSTLFGELTELLAFTQ
ncbi:unnamed protein product, partial [Mesorhabditis spiculigera]